MAQKILKTKFSQKNALILALSGDLRTCKTIFVKFMFGTVKATAFQGEGMIPSDFVGFFDLSVCPTGWSEAISARGRYVVGLPFGGTLAGTDGIALSNLEDRPVGQHSHSISDPGHSHSGTTNTAGTHTHIVSRPSDGSGSHMTTAINWGNSDFGTLDWQPLNPTTPAGDHSHFFTTNSIGTGISVGNVNTAGGSVSGTNAPYIQFLACQKN